MDSVKAFEEFEDKHQAQFDNIKVSYSPTVVVSVTLTTFRDVGVSGFSKWVIQLFGPNSADSALVDTPDPQFRVTCPKIDADHLKTFVTRNIDDDVTKGTIGQTFKFVVPKSLKPGESFPVDIELFDRDILFHDFIGKRTIEAADLNENGEPLQKTLIFGLNEGELDIIIKKELKTSPDFRYSLGMCEEEKAFRKKRIPIVHEAMKKLIVEDEGPSNLQETPVVSLVCSGGGYRAVTGMCGAMEALKDAGLLDTLMYTCALSGSAWYLSASYALQGISAEKQHSLHEGLRERMENNLFLDFVNPATYLEYQAYLDRSYNKYDQPHTFINYFPGFLVGRQLLGEKSNVKLTELAPYVETASVPFPIVSAIHVKNRVKAGDFHAYMERTPFENYLPCYGIGMEAKQESSSWNNGILVRERPEFPLDFTLGMTGCAFAILIHTLIESGGEKASKLLDYIDEERLKGKKGTEAEAMLSVDSDDEEEEVEDEEEEAYVKPTTPAAGVNVKMDTEANTEEQPTKAQDLEHKSFLASLSSLFSGRDFLGRTAKISNFAFGMERVRRYPLNPFGIPNKLEGEAKELVDAIGVAAAQKKISTKKETLSFVDAGILKNVPTDSVLRPQRTTDVMIVMDFNDYGSDDTFNYAPLLSAAAHAWQSGLKFPSIDFKVIANLPPKEFLAFPGDEEGCPTVLWFTLSNKKFRNDANYVPRSREKIPDNSKFNDFDVFGENSFCSSFTFKYPKHNFDRIRELMYYNVSSHIEEIKEALATATENKRKFLAKPQ